MSALQAFFNLNGGSTLEKTRFDAKNDFVVDEEFEKRIGGDVGR